MRRVVHKHRSTETSSVVAWVGADSGACWAACASTRCRVARRAAAGFGDACAAGGWAPTTGIARRCAGHRRDRVGGLGVGERLRERWRERLGSDDKQAACRYDGAAESPQIAASPPEPCKGSAGRAQELTRPCGARASILPRPPGLTPWAIPNRSFGASEKQTRGAGCIRCRPEFAGPWPLRETPSELRAAANWRATTRTQRREWSGASAFVSIRGNLLLGGLNGWTAGTERNIQHGMLNEQRRTQGPNVEHRTPNAELRISESGCAGERVRQARTVRTPITEVRTPCTRNLALASASR